MKEKTTPSGNYEESEFHRQAEWVWQSSGNTEPEDENTPGQDMDTYTKINPERTICFLPFSSCSSTCCTYFRWSWMVFDARFGGNTHRQ